MNPSQIIIRSISHAHLHDCSILMNSAKTINLSYSVSPPVFPTLFACGVCSEDIGEILTDGALEKTSEPHARRRQTPRARTRRRSDSAASLRGEMAVWMEWGGRGAWVNVRCSERMVIFNRAARRAGRIDSQAAGPPRNLITGRNLRQKESALINGSSCTRRGAAVRAAGVVWCEQRGGKWRMSPAQGCWMQSLSKSHIFFFKVLAIKRFSDGVNIQTSPSQ